MSKIGSMNSWRYLHDQLEEETFKYIFDFFKEIDFHED